MRWADLDAFGHVNNVVFVDYLQEARVNWQQGGPESIMTLVMVSQDLEYLAPLWFDFVPVDLELWVTRIGTSSIGISYEVYRAEPDGGRTVHLRARTVMVAVDPARSTTRPLTDAERTWAADYCDPDEPAVMTWSTSTHTEDGHYPLKVRFSDIDLGGIVNNVKHLEFFQEARIAVLARLMSRAGLSQLVPPLVIVRQQVEYKRPIRLRPQPYDAWTWSARLGTTSLTLEAEIRDQLDSDQLMARGRFVLVFVDPDTGRPAPPDPRLRAALQD